MPIAIFLYIIKVQCLVRFLITNGGKVEPPDGNGGTFGEVKYGTKGIVDNSSDQFMWMGKEGGGWVSYSAGGTVSFRFPTVEQNLFGEPRAFYSGIMGVLERSWTGGVEDGVQYDWDGKPIGFAPKTGSPDLLGDPVKGGVATSIAAYRVLRKFSKKGLIEAHKIVEWRHLKKLGISSKWDAPAVLLGKSHHSTFTKELLQILPKGAAYTKSQILDAYRKVYRDFPEWINAAENLLK
ncbi:MAG: hypothetical protein NVV82_19350 [Sporocytophaga sp.]|nr:hypothetical protein [Sporocytophaga sp.]